MNHRQKSLIDPSSRRYWECKWSEYTRRMRQLPSSHSEALSQEERKFFTTDKKGKLKKNDPATVELLIEQAIIVLKNSEFDDAEVDFLKELMTKSTPGIRGNKAIDLIHRLAAKHIFSRMIQDSETAENAEILTEEAKQERLSDQTHRLIKPQARRLLREWLDIEQGTLAKILKE